MFREKKSVAIFLTSSKFWGQFYWLRTWWCSVTLDVLLPGVDEYQWWMGAEKPPVLRQHAATTHLDEVVPPMSDPHDHTQAIPLAAPMVLEINVNTEV